MTRLAKPMWEAADVRNLQNRAAFTSPAMDAQRGKAAESLERETPRYPLNLVPRLKESTVRKALTVATTLRILFNLAVS